MADKDNLSSIAELVRTARERKGWSQTVLAEKVGTNQQTIEKIELQKTKNSSFLPKIFTVLELDLHKLVDLKSDKSGPPLIPSPGAALLGPRDLPVYGAAEGGKGAVVVSTDPVDYVGRPPFLHVRDGYGIFVVEDSMEPEFAPGDIALVNPLLPPTIGLTCIFYSDDGQGTVRACIKRLRRVASDAWHVRQWNPPDGDKADFILRRSEWQKCHVTVGRYNSRR